MLGVFASGFVGGCDRELSPPVASLPPPPPIQEFLKFRGCKAQPVRALNRREQCLFGRYKERCLPQDDCVVQCLASEESQRILDGCEHLCAFAAGNRVSPPAEIARCLEQS